jgi:transposase
MLKEGPMQVVYHRCCGLDIHKKLIVACLLLMTSQGVHKEMRTFGTTLADLYRLRDWLKANDCQMVAMEATGVYWKPIWNVLEEELALLLVNAQHMKAVPGRKTDVKDAEWIADLLQHGRLAREFRAAAPPTGTARSDALSDEARCAASRGHCISPAGGKNLKGGSWVTHLTWN